MTNSQTFNYDKALEVLKEIKEYIDFPQFQATFGENSDNVKAIIEETIVEEPITEEPSAQPEKKEKQE